MNDRLPASLAYILIYNPTLPPPANTSRDDEDAQEEAHILFYTSRERAASRDRMLRQVGLAKALVNFSNIFALGEGCDNVHSQVKRMIHVSPEPNFWMHVCADLARTRKPGKDDGKESKGKDPPAPTYYYHEDSLHDLALRHCLLRGYEAFKLLHGTFTSVLESRGSEGLQAQLEHFFTPWAWKWDLESPVEFSAHMGLPLHPLNSTFTPVVTSFFKKLPPNATPILVSPPYIIDPTPSPRYPPSLPMHLLSIVPPPGHLVPRQALSKRQNSSKATRTIATGSTNNTLGFLGAAGAGMGDAMNVKKWSWPGALSFGKQKPSQDKTGDTGKVDDLVKTIISPPPSETADQHEGEAQTIRGHVEGHVDQSALEDAISDQQPAALPDDFVRPLDESTNHPMIEALENNTDTSPATQRQKLDGDPYNSGLLPPSDTAPSPPPPSPSPPTDNPFSLLKVFVSEPSGPLDIQRRIVLYLSMYKLVFAILMDAGWLEDPSDQSLHALKHDAAGFLKDIRQAIDSRDARDSSALTERKTVPNRTRHVISSPQTAVSLSEGFSTTDSQFFEGQEMLANDSDRIEVFSRTVTPQHWFVARRGLGYNTAGERVEGEAYLETSTKDASLVDADNELVGVVRRWVDQDE